MDKVMKTAKYYHLLPFILLFLLFASISGSIGYYAVLMWIVYIVAFIAVIPPKLYYKETGRSYISDKINYKLGYFRMMNYFKDAEPHRLDTTQFPVNIWQNTTGIIFGKDDDRLVSIPSNSESNIAIFGPPGSGKTSGVAIINACRFDGSVMAVDIKGDLYNYVHKNTKRKILRFCPDDPDALETSCRFDPFDGFNKLSETEKKLTLENMALILVPDEGGQDGNYFPSRARKMFQGIVFLIFEENPDADFPTIIHRILEGNVFDWVKQAVNGHNAPAKEQLDSFYGNNEKNVSGAYDTLTTALIHFANPILDELLKKSDESVSVKTLDEGYDIYLQIKQEHLDVYASLFTLLLQTLSTQFTNRPDSSTGIKNRPILMLMDEFPQLTFSYKMINADLSTLRSKSVVIMIIQQNMSQLEERYKDTGARSIIGNCNYQIILGSNDDKTSEAFSKKFGTKKVLKRGDNTGKGGGNSGNNISEANESVFPPEKFGDLSAEKKMIVYFKGKYCELTKINCYVDKIDGIQELPGKTVNPTVQVANRQNNMPSFDSLNAGLNRIKDSLSDKKEEPAQSMPHMNSGEQAPAVKKVVVIKKKKIS